MTRLRLLLLALATTLAGGAPARAEAQITGAMGVSLDILYPALSGSGIRPLDFGAVIPGAGAVTVLPNTPRGAEFRIKGTRTRKSIDITITLPTALIGPAGATIPVSFNGNYAALCELDVTGVCLAASYFEWNPVTTPTFRDTPTRYSPGRKTYTYDDYSVYIGGVITPPAALRPGHYAGSIAMTIVIN